MKILFALLVLLLSTGVAAQTQDKHDEALSQYLPYAGEPVDSFQFWALKRWELVGEYKVVIWPRLNEAYLVTVDAPCDDLRWAKAISVTSSANRVYQRFSFVRAGKYKCRIKEIQPIDYKKLLADRKAAKAAKEEKGG